MAEAGRPDLVIGVAGWSYPDWKGIVYPANCKDTLRAVAQKAPLIEINNTFYRPPAAKNCASWVARTAEFGTLFTAKLPRECTHERTTDAAFFAAVRAGFAPLLASGRCGGLLAQFNHELVFGRVAIEHVALLAQHFGQETQLFVEVRHRSWNAAPALDALRGLGVSVVALDYPGLASGFAADVPGANGRRGLAYFRLHGRNPAWFQHGAGRDQVYGWRYSAAEVEQLQQRALRIGEGATRTLVVANNHFHGKAMVLVEQLLAWYRDLADGAGGARGGA